MIAGLTAGEERTCAELARLAIADGHRPWGPLRRQRCPGAEPAEPPVDRHVEVRMQAAEIGGEIGQSDVALDGDDVELTSTVAHRCGVGGCEQRLDLRRRLGTSEEVTLAFVTQQ